MKRLALALTLVGAAACRSCSCQGTENCEECVARCVDSQGVSEELCKGSACVSVCPQQGNQ